MAMIPSYENIELDIVGGSDFGRYSKISAQKTYNMMISDKWLVDFAGHKKIATIESSGKGRGIFNSTVWNKLIVVVNNGVYVVDDTFFPSLIARIDTFDGDVVMAENNANQIAICDGNSIWILDYRNNSFDKASIDFNPSYITSQNGRFIASIEDKPAWRFSDLNNGKSWPAENKGTFQTKTDIMQACIRLPGQGNNLLMMGKIGCEVWVDVGAQIFSYQKVTSYNLDYGVANPATIANGDNFVVWLGINEKSGPAILYTTGGHEIQQISTDGINYALAQLNNPYNSYGFLFKQDGHLFYQLTFPDPKDNWSIAFDFTTKKFFNLCDEKENYHIAKKAEYFNNSYYFLSFKDGDLYEQNSIYTTYNGEIIPRIRIPSTFRRKDNKQFIAYKLSLLMEQGEASIVTPAIDISVSRNGGRNFGSYKRIVMNNAGHNKNMVIDYGLGMCNEFTPQFRFWGDCRFVIGESFLGIY